MTKVKSSFSPSDGMIVAAEQLDQNAPATLRRKRKNSSPSYDYIKLAKTVLTTFVAVGAAAAPVIYYSYFYNTKPLRDPGLEKWEDILNIVKSAGLLAGLSYLYMNNGAGENLSRNERQSNIDTNSTQTNAEINLFKGKPLYDLIERGYKVLDEVYANQPPNEERKKELLENIEEIIGGCQCYKGEPSYKGEHKSVMIEKLERGKKSLLGLIPDSKIEQSEPIVGDISQKSKIHFPRNVSQELQDKHNPGNKNLNQGNKRKPITASIINNYPPLQNKELPTIPVKKIEQGSLEDQILRFYDNPTAKGKKDLLERIERTLKDPNVEFKDGTKTFYEMLKREKWDFEQSDEEQQFPDEWENLSMLSTQREQKTLALPSPGSSSLASHCPNINSESMDYINKLIQNRLNNPSLENHTLSIAEEGNRILDKFLELKNPSDQEKESLSTEIDRIINICFDDGGNFQELVQALLDAKDSLSQISSSFNEIDLQKPAKIQKSIQDLTLEKIGLGAFFDVCDHAEATKFIDKFNPKSEFPCHLWDFSENFPSKDIPYKDLNGIRDDSRYVISSEEWERFNKDLLISLNTMFDVVNSSNVKNHEEILKCCEDLNKKLIEINCFKADNESLVGTEIDENNNITIMISDALFTSLKMDSPLIRKLQTELKNLERENLIKFLSSLAFLTLEGKNQNRQIISDGLEKLRQYITERRPRLREKMGFNQVAGAQPIYEMCLDYLFLNQEDKEKFNKLMKDDSDEDVIVASIRHSSGGTYTGKDNTSGHYTCDVITAKNTVENLDTIGISRKTGSNFGSSNLEENISFEGETEAVKVSDESHLILSKSFYLDCVPLNLEKISVPFWQYNNCYLASGWLKFCVFLHFFKQLKV